MTLRKVQLPAYINIHLHRSLTILISRHTILDRKYSFMHRKRDDVDKDQNETDFVTKKLKNKGILLRSKQLSNSLAVDVDEHAGKNRFNLSKSLAQSSSSSVMPSRKRRPRNSHQFNSNKSSTTNTDRSDLSCVVCCAVAHGYNFDAISCESCKAFFRRNALFSSDRFKCRRNGNCEITLETRRRCKACRLGKCFAVGMRKEWILTEEEKVNKKRRIEENRKLQADNTSSLTEPHGRIEPDLKNLVFRKTKKPSPQFTPSNDIIANVVMAYNDGITLDLTSYGWSYPLARKITGLCQIINTKNNTALRLISFYKRLDDFEILNEVDKINLMKTNLPYIFFLHSSLNYDPAHDVYYQENTTEKPLHGVDIREAYSAYSYMRLTKVMCALNSIVQIDKRIMQVALVIILFSKGLSTTIDPNQPVINNHQQVLEIQNKYVEQLWLSIEKIYGRMRAVYVFSTLISKCLSIQELIRDIQHDVYE